MQVGPLFWGQAPLMRPLTVRSPVDAQPSSADHVLLPATPHLDLGDLDRQLDQAGSVSVGGNKTQLLIGGKEGFDALYERLEKATSHIELATYHFNNDETGQRLADILALKAIQGVRVHVVYDKLGMKGRDVSHLEALKTYGVQVTALDNWRLSPHVRDIQHRKLYLVDGQSAFVGGMNLEDFSSKYARDALVQIEGPSVHHLAKTFQELWKAADGEGSPPLDPPSPAAGTQNVRILETSPQHEQFKVGLYRAVEKAQHHVYLEQAYFTDDGLVRRLKEAAARGVDVRVIVPDIPQIGFETITRAMRASLPGLVKAGVKVYLYPDRLHSKIATIDGLWSTVGSTNTDNRALSHNYELSVALPGQAPAKELETRLFQVDFQKSTLLTPESAKKLQGNWKEKLLDRLYEAVDFAF